MATRREFARQIAALNLSTLERAVAFLWYYSATQEYEERTASELAADLHDEGFPKPNVSRLQAQLRTSRQTRRGKRPGTFQIDVRVIPLLNESYLDFLGVKQVEVVGAVLPVNSLKGTRRYLEQLSHQINASYESGLFDGAAVLMRRLMESLLLEIYISRGRQSEIQSNGTFLMLSRLIAYVKSDGSLSLSRAFARTVDEIKQLGDTAAHDRTYLTQMIDIDDLKARYRKLIEELLVLAKVRS